MFKQYFTLKNIIFLLLVIFLIYIMPKVTGIALLFFAAYVIACALNPYVTKMQERFGRNTASIIAVLVGTAAVLHYLFLYYSLPTKKYEPLLCISRKNW